MSLRIPAVDWTVPVELEGSALGAGPGIVRRAGGQGRAPATPWRSRRSTRRPRLRPARRTRKKSRWPVGGTRVVRGANSERPASRPVRDGSVQADSFASPPASPARPSARIRGKWHTAAGSGTRTPRQPRQGSPPGARAASPRARRAPPVPVAPVRSAKRGVLLPGGLRPQQQLRRDTATQGHPPPNGSAGAIASTTAWPQRGRPGVGGQPRSGGRPAGRQSGSAIATRDRTGGRERRPAAQTRSARRTAQPAIRLRLIAARTGQRPRRRTPAGPRPEASRVLQPLIQGAHGLRRAEN